MKTILIILAVVAVSYIAYTAGYLDGAETALEEVQKVFDEFFENEEGNPGENSELQSSARDDS